MFVAVASFPDLLSSLLVYKPKNEGRPGNKAKGSSIQGRGVGPISYLAESDIVHTLGLQPYSIIESTGDEMIRTPQHVTDRNTLGSPQHQAHNSLVL